MPETWLRIEDVCERLNLNRHQVYRRIQSGQLPASLERGEKLRYLVAESDVENYEATGGSSRMVGTVPGGAMLRVPDVANILGFTSETVRRMCENGDLSFVRGVGKKGHYRIPRSTVNDYLARHGMESV